MNKIPIIRNLLYTLIVTGLFAACKSGGNAVLFELLPESKTGIRFRNTLTESDSLNALNFMNIYHGSGVGIGDFNNDSLPDIFLAGNMVSSQLYLNKSGFRFSDITSAAGVHTAQWINGVSVVDINQDGWKDIYLCVGNLGDSARAANLLFINQGLDASGIPTFREMASDYGLDNRAYSMQATFFDYDGDADLDMYLLNNGIASAKTNYSIRPKLLKGESETTDQLYRNDGGVDHPHFTNVSGPAGITAEGFGLGLAISDLNNDGLADIYVSNDFISSDLLWINNGNGTFTDRNNEFLQHTSLNGMGVDIADINNDGWNDIMQLDMLPMDNFRRKMMLNKANYNSFLYQRSLGYQAQFVRNVLQINRGPGPDSALYFSELAQMNGLAATDWSWAPLLADFDNDGFKDIFITNGYRRNITDLDFINYDFLSQTRFGTADYKKSTYKKQLEKLPEIKIADCIFRNEEGQRFKEMGASWGIDIPSFSTGASYADLDNDGDLDLVVNGIDQPIMVYQNHTKNKSVSVHLIGDAPNKDGIGTKITAFAADKTLYFENYSSRGYLSSVDSRLIIGLGNAGVIDSMVIQWPDGRSETKTGIAAGGKIICRQSDAMRRYFKKSTVAGDHLLKDATPAGLQMQTIPEAVNDFNRNALIPYGPSGKMFCIAVADLNDDGLDDFFIGGKGRANRFFLIQNPDGSFRRQIFAVSKNSDDVDAVFFDADNDGDQDLYVVSGGVSYGTSSEAYQDRLYMNRGNLDFKESDSLIPVETTSGSCVAAADYDLDGDIDLFVGAKFIPEQYPIPGKSMLLRNERGKFILVNGQQNMVELKTEMINAAVWADVNGDGYPELLTAGEFSGIALYRNNKGNLKLDENGGELDQKGWWTSLAAGDMDGDGDMDLVAGNLGRNTHFHASAEKPMSVYAADLDKNGRVEPIIGIYLPGKNGDSLLFPEMPRDELAQQYAGIRKKYERYEYFANAGLFDIIGPELKNAWHRDIRNLNSCYFENVGNGKFKVSSLPDECQTAPIQKILITDLNNDGKADILAGGNDYSWESRNGYSDASFGYALLGGTKGKFRPLKNHESGWYQKGEIVALKQFRGPHSSKRIISVSHFGEIKILAIGK